MKRWSTVDDFLSLPKTARGHASWVARPNHAGSVIAVFSVLDATGATFPGLTLQLEAKAPIVVDQCLYLFTFLQFARGVRGRLYQLEVCPSQKKSHVDSNQVIHGPHEHLEEACPVVDASVQCGDWAAAYAWFLRRCNLNAPNMSAPC